MDKSQSRLPPLDKNRPATVAAEAPPKRARSPHSDSERWDSLDPECIAVLEELARGLPTSPHRPEDRPTVSQFLALVKQKDAAVKSLHQLFTDLETKDTLEQNSKMKQKLEKMEEFVESNRGQLDELARQRDRVDELARKLSQEQASKEELEKARADLEQQVDSLSAELSVLTTVSKALKKKEAVYQAELAKLAQEKEVLEQQAGEARQEQEDRIADATRIHTQLTTALERVTARTEQLDKQSKDQAVSLMHQIALNDAEAAREARLERRRREAEAIDRAKYPMGEVTLVFTDIQASTAQWEEMPEAMGRALRIHDDIARTALREDGGYEVKTEGDSFMLAFRTPLSAVRWCTKVQQRLLEADWPEELLRNKFSCVEADSASGAPMFRGLRVRMGAHLCKPQTQLDASTGRIDYVGVAVNHAARIAGSATGGQILISESTLSPIRAELGQDVVVAPFGEITLNLVMTEKLYQVLPKSLSARNFERREFQPSHASKNSLTLKYVQMNQLETKLEQIVGVIDKTLDGRVAEAARDAGEPQSEEALKSRLRVAGAQLADMREKIAEETKRRNALKEKVGRKQKRVDELRDELQQRRSERELYKRIADDYTCEKRAKDMALVKANAVTFCLLLKESILEQQLQAMNAEKELYAKQAESIMAQTRKLGVQVMDLKDLDKLSSEQLAKIEAASLAERQRYLEDELARLRADIAMYEKMLEDLSKHAQQGAQEEANAQKAEAQKAAAAAAPAKKPAEKKDKDKEEGKEGKEGEEEAGADEASPEALLEHQAELQEELATINTELKGLEEQLNSLEDRMKAVVEDATTSAPTVSALEKKKTLLQYKVNRVMQEKRRLERQLSSLREIHAEEKKLVEAALAQQEKQSIAINRKLRMFEESLKQHTT
eukprot:m51a1_g1583 putative adenylate cyclase (897) ;mRNA; f:118841-122058